jgi:alkylation response protein AidB-like acyl-CoA dehydrogenase
MGLSLFEHGLISEELGRTPLGHYVFNCQAPDAGNMEILIEHGTPEQKETLPDAPAARRRAQLLLHDRTGQPWLQPDDG